MLREIWSVQIGCIENQILEVRQKEGHFGCWLVEVRERGGSLHKHSRWDIEKRKGIRQT